MGICTKNILPAVMIMVILSTVGVRGRPVRSQDIAGTRQKNLEMEGVTEGTNQLESQDNSDAIVEEREDLEYDFEESGRYRRSH